MQMHLHVHVCTCTREVVVTGRAAAGRLETRDNKSFWLVATCESRKPGEAVYLEHLAQSISTWRYDAENPDDKMLWDLEPDTYYGDPTGKDLWYLVSNAASRNPNEMLYLTQIGHVGMWKFSYDEKAKWELRRAPPPPPPDKCEGGLNAGEIAGIAVGVTFLVLCICAGVCAGICAGCS